jgi:hypothetical protein
MAEMEKLITGALARALEEGRPRYNALFAQARHATPTLDPRAFADHLRDTVAPVVEAVAAVAPERAGAVTDVLYEFSLDLVAKDFLTRHPALARGWLTLLAGLPRHLAATPRQFAGSVTNALYNLAQTPGARPVEWAAELLRLGELCADVPALLEAGQVCAWRAGLAHYRDGALAACARLEPRLARAALGLAAADGDAPLDELLRQLRADPWLHPAAVGRPAKKRLRLVARVGAFRGFGGAFLRPPRVACADGQLLVSDGETCWLLCADVFGATLHRTAADLPADGTPGRSPVDARGKVTHAGENAAFAELRGSSSAAACGPTLAVTLPLSHVVFLVAAQADGPAC